MKRQIFRHGLTAALAALLLGCAPQPSRMPVPPPVQHTAPVRDAINLTPTREIPVIAPPGSGLGAPGTNDTGVPTQTASRIVRVGLLLPLTGRSAELGKSLQDAATISLFDKYARISTAMADTRVELLPKDTGDTPEQAATAMKEALDDGAQLIIGPVFGPSTEAAAPLATAKQVPVISFTNNRALAKPGVYAFGFSPEEQTARIVNYAQQQDKGRIAALVPNSASGELVLGAARKAMAASNTVLVAETKYGAQGVGIDSALNQMIPGGAVGFNAVLLPEGGSSLGTILRALNTRGVNGSNVQFLGTGLWDEPNLLRRVSLDGAWLASSPPNLTAQFEQRFMQTYGYVPPRIASLAYDAVALAVTLATSDRPLDEATLTQNAGYSGPANGIFRFRPNGMVERNLAVLRVEGANLIVIDPAPGGFTAATPPSGR